MSGNDETPAPPAPETPQPPHECVVKFGAETILASKAGQILDQMLEERPDLLAALIGRAFTGVSAASGLPRRPGAPTSRG